MKEGMNMRDLIEEKKKNNKKKIGGRAKEIYKGEDKTNLSLFRVSGLLIRVPFQGQLSISTGGSIEEQRGAAAPLLAGNFLWMSEFAPSLLPTNCSTKCLKDVVLFAAV
ncbi:unnamed protein product [Prunus armeniaca]|nr:hypothetical protein GBA52_009116 [Prunus armeniaca]